MPSATPAPSAQPWRLLREVPLVGGLVLAVVVLRVAGQLFVPLPWPMGNDWAQSYDLALQLAEGTPLHGGFDAPRSAVWAWLASRLARVGGYQLAATTIGSAAALATVLATGVAVRVLAGPWLAGVAAVAVAGVPVLLLGVHWMDHYALLAGLTSLALACTATYLRWPRLWALMPMACVAGLATAVDPRGAFLPVIAVVAVLSAAKVLRARGTTLHLLLAIGIACACASTPRLFGAAPSQDRGIMLRAVRLYSERHACRALATEPQQRAPGPARLEDYLNRCTLAIVDQGLAESRREGNLPPWPCWLLLVPLLLPDPRGGRRWVGSLLVAGVPLGAMLLGATLALYKSSYALQFALPLVSAVPLALDRLVRVARSRWPGATWLHGVAIVAACVALGAWPLRRASVAAESWTGHANPRADQLLSLARELQPEGPRVDCSGWRLWALWRAPNEVDSDRSGLRVEGALRCGERARQEAQGPATIVVSALEGELGARLEQAGWRREAELPCMAGAPPLELWVEEEPSRPALHPPSGHPLPEGEGAG